MKANPIIIYKIIKEFENVIGAWLFTYKYMIYLKVSKNFE